MKLIWYGHSCFVVQTAEGSAAFDPYIDGMVPVLAPLSVAERSCDLLGRGIASACTVIDPEAVVLGGEVSLAGEFLRRRVEDAFRKYAFHACSETKICLATLGSEAGIYGNARLAMLG